MLFSIPRHLRRMDSLDGDNKTTIVLAIAQALRECETAKLPYDRAVAINQFFMLLNTRAGHLYMQKNPEFAAAVVQKIDQLIQDPVLYRVPLFDEEVWRNVYRVATN